MKDNDLKLNGFDAGKAEGLLGQRVREARKAVGLTVEQCGYCIDPVDAKSGAGWWRGLESRGGVPDAYEALIVEAVLGVPAMALIFGTATMARARRWALDKLRGYPRPAKR